MMSAIRILQLPGYHLDYLDIIWNFFLVIFIVPGVENVVLVRSVILGSGLQKLSLSLLQFNQMDLKYDGSVLLISN